jgi:hypothetical protein
METIIQGRTDLAVLKRLCIRIVTESKRTDAGTRGMDVVKRELVCHTAERKSEKIPTWILIATSTELGTHRSVHTKFTGTAPSMETCSRTKRNSKHDSEALKLIGFYNNVGKHRYAFSVPQQPCCKQYFPDVKTRLMLASMLKAPDVLLLQDRGIKVDVNHLSWLSKAHQPRRFSFYSTTVQQYNRQRCKRY